MATDVYNQIKKNTFSAENQVEISKQIQLANPHGKGKRYLFLGNSITLCGGAPEKGWQGGWGMAASSMDKDYVHRIMAEVSKTDADAALCICQVSRWEMNYKNPHEVTKLYDVARDFGADVIITRFVENCSVPDFEPEVFISEYEKFIKSFDTSSKAKFILTTGFWKHPGNEQIRLVAEKNGYEFVVLEDLGEDDSMKALGLFEHTGIAEHPGDKGMEHIANRILKHI